MDLTCEELRRIILYDPQTGSFTWKVAAARRVKVGGPAGGKSGRYVCIRIHGRLYRAHRLAWLYVTGQWPKDQVDHINGVEDDNRFLNLREATNTENQRNRKKKKDNTSGFKGVCFVKSKRLWMASIVVQRKSINLGYFRAPEDAHRAYCAAAKKYHGQFANF